MNEDKRKRGRPSVMSKELEEGLRNLFITARTRRQLIDKHYAIDAGTIVKGMLDEGVDGLEYLFNRQTGDVNFGVLAEIGRLKDERLIRFFAIAICQAQAQPETRATVKQWQRYLRLLRLHPNVLEALISEAASENEPVGDTK